MEIITIDGTRWPVKYQQNKESVSVENGTSESNYPNFIGSKMNQNSTSSDIYALNFAILRSQYKTFKEAFKKFITNDDDALDDDDEYGKLTHIILVHDEWGAFRGLVKGKVVYDTSGIGDVKVSCVFQEHTADEPLKQKDLEQENEEATDEVDDETNDGEFEEADRPALLVFLENLQALYDKIQNSALVAAFNDLKSALNDALLNYQKVMNAVKKILSLPNSIISGVRGKIDFFKKQANVIKNIPASTFNLARFHMSCFSFNQAQFSRMPFYARSAATSRTGVKVAPIT